jgi:hypothetical protein
MNATNKDLEPTDSRYIIQTYAIGDLVTEKFYTDSKAGRVIAVARKGKEVTMQHDISTLDPSFKPETILGGFVGHTVNNNDQTYTYEADPDGVISVHTLRSWRGIKIWTRKGETPNGRNTIVPGQSTFYDYNF